MSAETSFPTAPGINMREKAVLQQRAANMIAAQTSYVEKQKAALN
jgi:hypothetical protein